jgi:hypothetical protein
MQIKKPLKTQRLKRPEPRLTQTAFFDRSFLGLGAFDLTARCEPLVTQYAQGFDLGALSTAFAVFQHLHIAWAGQAVFVGFA